LNDSDIHGAKWVLININSAEGEFECTMDELEIINTYLRLQAGNEADVIMGMGFDDTLGKKVSVTIIATGFDAKEIVKNFVTDEQETISRDKIVMTLGVEGEEKKMTEQPQPLQQTVLQFKEEEKELTDSVVNEEGIPMPEMKIIINPHHSSEIKTQHASSKQESLQIELNPEITDQSAELSVNEAQQEPIAEKAADELLRFKLTERKQPILSKPANIYAEQKGTAQQPEEKPIMQKNKQQEQEEEQQPTMSEMFLSEKEMETPMRETEPVISSVETGNEDDEAEIKRRKAHERIQKLRNLSFNMNTADPNSEFESVPAYIRRNMELFGNAIHSVENFYSKYTVNKDEKENTHISKFNTFLEGKKPD
jgi:cell division protein FtsZ